MHFVSALSNPIAKVFAHTFGYEELGVFGPAVEALGQANLVCSERLAMRFAGGVLVRRSVPDVAIDDDERRPVFRIEECLVTARQHLHVIRITDPGDIPSVAHESGHDVFAERPGGGAIERYLIVVVHPAEIAELEMPGKGGGFGGNALHQISIAAHGIDIEIENLKAGTIIGGSQPAARDGDAYTVSTTLTQRSGGGFYSGGQMGLGVPGSAAAELSKALDLVERDGQFVGDLGIAFHPPYACEIKKRIAEHVCVAVGEHEAIAVRPYGILGIVTQELLPKRVRNRRESHGCARVAGIC